MNFPWDDLIKLATAIILLVAALVSFKKSVVLNTNHKKGPQFPTVRIPFGLVKKSFWTVNNLSIHGH